MAMKRAKPASPRQATSATARHGESAIRRLLYTSPIYDLSLSGKAPAGLRLTPTRRHAGNAIIGKEILSGDFPIKHRRGVRLGIDPWKRPLSGSEQSESLHGFSWLADLEAIGSEEARLRGRELLLGWISNFGRWQEPAWYPDVLGGRLTAWVCGFEFFVSADDGIAGRVLDSAMRQTRHLGRACAQSPTDWRRFRAVHGLVLSAICLPGAETLLDRALGQLESAIGRQILPDGCHFERNPTRHLEVLDTLVSIQSLLVTTHIEGPIALMGAIDRMTPMLRAFRHGDGKLSLFNGSSEGDRAAIESVITDSGVRGKALTSAPHSGFQRLTAGRTTVIIDAGKPQPGGGHTAHAGALGFEMSIGKERLIVNCGHRDNSLEWLEASRTTAAHSALTVDDTNSMEFLPDGHIGAGPNRVQCTRKESDGAVWLEMGHDGYAKTVGVNVRRNLFLSADGNDLRGEDIIEGSEGSRFDVRFHLHPGVHASLLHDRTAVLLKLPSGAGWRLMANGGDVSLEESVYLDGGIENRRTEQIVVSGPLNGDGAVIKWRIYRLKD